MSDIYNQTVAYEPNYDDYPSEVIAISKFNMLFAQHEWFFDVSSKKKANMVCKALNENAQLQATIADKDAEIAELKLWVKDRNKIMLEQAKELSLLKEVAAAIISEDPEDHKPVCCGGSIQSMCGCMGATPISMAYYELRKLLKPTINPIGDK